MQTLTLPLPVSTCLNTVISRPVARRVAIIFTPSRPPVAPAAARDAPTPSPTQAQAKTQTQASQPRCSHTNASRACTSCRTGVRGGVDRGHAGADGPRRQAQMQAAATGLQHAETEVAVRAAWSLHAAAVHSRQRVAECSMEDEMARLRRERSRFETRMEHAIGASQLRNVMYKRRLRSQSTAAQRRLQELLFECIGELASATHRQSTGSDDDAAQRAIMREAQRDALWRLFLLKLAEDASPIHHTAELSASAAQQMRALLGGRKDDEGTAGSGTLRRSKRGGAKCGARGVSARANAGLLRAAASQAAGVGRVAPCCWARTCPMIFP